MKQTYRALNGLRFLAASAIVIYHHGQTTTGFSTIPNFLQNLVLTGPIGLGFFYILSGFVLTHAYSDRIPQTTASRQSLWFARVARLYPVYLLAFEIFSPMAYEKYIRIRRRGKRRSHIRSGRDAESCGTSGLDTACAGMERPKLVDLRGGIFLPDFPVRSAKNPGASTESFTTNPLGALVTM